MGGSWGFETLTGTVGLKQLKHLAAEDLIEKRHG